MEEATAVAGMVELQVERASISLPREDENEKSVGNDGSCKGLNPGLVYTPMRITRSMASLNSAFIRSLGLAGGETAGEGEAEAEAEAEAESTGVKKTGKRSNGRGARKKWGKSSVVEHLDASEGEMQPSRRKKAVNVKPGAKAADGKRSKAQPQGGKKKAGRASASKRKEKEEEKVGPVEPVHTANEADQVGEDVSSGVTEGDTAKANQVQTKQKLSSSPVGWVMCDDCGKWRCISAELADRIEASDARWTCRDNPNRTYADCSVPQEKSNAEINAELNITEGSSSDCDDADAVVNSKSRATWTQIRRNIFAHRKPKNSDEDEGLTCQCKPLKDGLGCGDVCLNRMMNVECSPETCPCGDRCSNQQFQKRMYAKFALVRCGKKGFGLRAREFIPKGSFIIEYVGEVLNTKAFGARQKDYARQRQKHFYFMTLSSSEVIDACRKGNYGRFINHSCEPNCQTEKWVVNGEVCIGLFAIRDVRENEEITFNYNYERLLGAAAKKCRCGSVNCQGYIGGDPSSPMDVVPSESEDDLEPVMVKEEDDSEEEDLTETQESVQDMKATPASDVLPWESTMEPEREPEREHVTETGPRPEPEPQPQQEPEPAPELKPKSLPKPLETKPEALKPKTRIKRLKSSGRPKKAQPKEFKSIAAPKRFISEVEEKLDNLLNQEGGLVKKKDTPKQYLKLLVIATASGDSSTSCNMRELSLLLDAILKTASRTILTEVIQKNGLQLLHNLVKQSRKSFTRTPILRKLLKVLAFFAEKKIINSQDMTLAASRNGMESFVKSIFELQRHEDSEVQQLSRRFQKQWLPDALDLLAHESSGNQNVHRSWGPDRFSQRRELFHSRPDDRQRKFKRPDDSDRQDRNQDVKRRRISRWDEAPSSAPAPSHQSHGGSQESRPASREHAQEDGSEPPGYGSRCSHPQEPVDYHNQPRDNWNHHWNQREQVRDYRGGYSYHPPNESSHYSDYPGRRQYQQPQHEVAHSLHPPRYSRAAPPTSRPLPPVNGYYYAPPPSYTHPHGVSSHYRNVSGCYSHPPQQYLADDEPPVPGL